MKTTLFLSSVLLATGALAATNGTSTQFIPSGISSGCSTFINTLNTDSGLASCTSDILTATSGFATTSSSNTSASSALSSLCGSDSCSDVAIRTLLSDFYSSCSDDLSSNSDLVMLYDLLYTFKPFKNAACSKDTNNNFCVKSLVSSPSSKKKRDAQLTLPAVNAGDMQSKGTPFLFLTTNTASDKICTACGASVIKTYTAWEQSLPYALGLDKSPLLGGQVGLINSVNSKCGSTFLTGSTGNTGSGPASGGLANSASMVKMSGNQAIVAATFAGFLGLVMAFSA